MAKAINYTGFGEVHGLREWARLLDVNKDTLRYWLTTKKVTIEEFAEKNGIKYAPTIDEGRTRTNRLAQAEELLNHLFARSGYNTELLTCETLSGKRTQRVIYDGEIVGIYNIDTGSLKFKDGYDEGVNLIDYPVPEPKIYRYPARTVDGLHGAEHRPAQWGVHPTTKTELVSAIMGTY